MRPAEGGIRIGGSMRMRKEEMPLGYNIIHRVSAGGLRESRRLADGGSLKEESKGESCK